MAQGTIPNLLGQIIMENDIFKKEHIYVCVRMRVCKIESLYYTAEASTTPVNQFYFNEKNNNETTVPWILVSLFPPN